MPQPETPSPATESTVDRPTPGAPSDSATLTEMLNTLATDGFVNQFSPLEAAAVECSQCRARVDASALDVTSIRRLEGASDPDDMMSLVAARCPNCDGLGTLVLGYGVNASADDADISKVLGVSEEAREIRLPGPD